MRENSPNDSFLSLFLSQAEKFRLKAAVERFVIKKENKRADEGHAKEKEIKINTHLRSKNVQRLFKDERQICSKILVKTAGKLYIFFPGGVGEVLTRLRTTKQLD